MGDFLTEGDGDKGSGDKYAFRFVTLIMKIRTLNVDTLDTLVTHLERRMLRVTDVGKLNNMKLFCTFVEKVRSEK